MNATTRTHNKCQIFNVEILRFDATTVETNLKNLGEILGHATLNASPKNDKNIKTRMLASERLNYWFQFIRPEFAAKSVSEGIQRATN